MQYVCLWQPNLKILLLIFECIFVQFKNVRTGCLAKTAMKLQMNDMDHDHVQNNIKIESVITPYLYTIPLHCMKKNNAMLNIMVGNDTPRIIKLHYLVNF